MGIFLRNNWYYFKKQIEGKVYRKSLRIRKGQEYLLSARLRQVEEEILAHHFGLNYSPRKEITFLEFKERYRELKKYKKTLELDLRRLEIMNECLNNPLLSQISKREIEKLENFLLERERIEKETTVNRYFSLLKHFLNLAIEEGFLKENPVVKYYRTFVESSERRALTKREIRKVLSAAKEIQKNPRSQTQRIIFDLILFALNTGMAGSNPAGRIFNSELYLDFSSFSDFSIFLFFLIFSESVLKFVLTSEAGFTTRKRPEKSGASL